MERTTPHWRRAALMLGAVAFVAAVAAPASAMARTATRILVTSTKSTVAYTTDWSHPGTSPVAPVLTARLQQKTRTGWKALKGTLYVYRNDSSNDTLAQFTYLKSYSASTAGLRYTLGTRGKYKFYFKGTSTLAPSTAYATRQDYLGDRLSLESSSVVLDAGGASVAVTLKYNVSWNTDGFMVTKVTDASGSYYTDGPVFLRVDAAFEPPDGSTDSGYTTFFQDSWDPRTIEFSFHVPFGVGSNYVGGSDWMLHAAASIRSADPYIKAKASTAQIVAIAPPQ